MLGNVSEPLWTLVLCHPQVPAAENPASTCSRAWWFPLGSSRELWQPLTWPQAGSAISPATPVRGQLVGAGVSSTRGIPVWEAVSALWLGTASSQAETPVPWGEGCPVPQCPCPGGPGLSPGIGDGGATAGWRICRGHYLMLRVNGGTAANSRACNPLPPPGTGSVPVTHPRAPGTSPRQLPRRFRGPERLPDHGGCAEGKRGPVTSHRLQRGCAAPALSGGARRAGRAGLCLGRASPACPGAERGPQGWDSTLCKWGNWGWVDLLWGHPKPEHLGSWALVLAQAIDTRHPKPTACPVLPSQTRVLCSDSAPHRAPLAPPAPRGCSPSSRS